MIDINNLKQSPTPLSVVPSDRIFAELGNNTYDFKDLLSELIDNAVAAKHPDRVLHVWIELFADQRSVAKRIVVRDDASGIPLERLAPAITLAGIQTKGSLNEHGLGMKQAIAGLGELEYLATKTLGSHRANVILEFKFGDLACYESDFDLDSGTEISIRNIRAVANIPAISITTTLVPYLGARYRRFLRPDNKRLALEITVKNASTGNVQYSWDVQEHKPIYFHPGTRTNKPVISNRMLQGNGWKAEVTFGYAPTDDEYKELGIEKPPQHHPYNVSLAKQGLDVILYDRVVLFHQLSELGLTTTRHPDYNRIRGEIVLIEGFATAITKNSIIRDANFNDCIREIRRILSGEGEGGGRNYLQERRYPEAVPERLLRDRLANWLENNPLQRKQNVLKEYAVQGLDGNIDILADGEAWEIKRDQANGLDVYQLFAYIDMGQISKGFLIAASFSPGATAAASFIKQHHNKDIVLSDLGQFPINHPPSDDERADYY